MRLSTLFGFLVFGLVAASSVNADVLLLETISDASESSLSRPANGAGMTAVENRFGKPESTVVQVGEPPITRWIYPDFTVYFEFDKVIHSVVHRANSTPGLP